jgi:pimeloyl-ACP methyl ester carboxylesterase
MTKNAVLALNMDDENVINTPTALIPGTNDNFLKPEKGRKISEAMPNGSFYSIPDSGHLPWLENPKGNTGYLELRASAGCRGIMLRLVRELT